MSQWTLISNHGAVLALIAKHERITVREIASGIGITERSVHRIISDLQSGGYIWKEKLGRANKYRVSHSKPLRRLELHDTLIGELLKIFVNGSGARKKKAAYKAK